VSESVGKRAVKLAISAVLHAGDRVVGAVVSSRRLAGRSPGIVLLYHGVPDDQQERFGAQLDQLGRLGSLVALDDLHVAPDGTWRIAVTFDDGLRSYAERAVPEMTARQVPSTVFIPSCVVGTVPAWAGADGYEPLMTADVVRSLPPDLVRVGSHSRAHARLPELGAEHLRKEVAGSKAELEAMTGRPVTRLAFPYGDWSDAVLAAAVDAGYTRVYTVSPEPVADPEGFSVGRATLEPSDWRLEVRLKALGAYRWVGWWMAFKRWRRA
jgi:peptidoglycan/xylan/chitin deacetylase (PgdA/CDA1 family)